ncbi:hypothetical protein LX36DRAFT_56488 [Colletotrichum falcatum]|nr:hypothetical protein LX36DRAFT_56488 [Colletotrichum falcatum]
MAETLGWKFPIGGWLTTKRTLAAEISMKKGLFVYGACCVFCFGERCVAKRLDGRGVTRFFICALEAFHKASRDSHPLLQQLRRLLDRHPGRVSTLPELGTIELVGTAFGRGDREKGPVRLGKCFCQRCSKRRSLSPRPAVAAYPCSRHLNWISGCRLAFSGGGGGGSSTRQLRVPQCFPLATFTVPLGASRGTTVASQAEDWLVVSRVGTVNPPPRGRVQWDVERREIKPCLVRSAPTPPRPGLSGGAHRGHIAAICHSGSFCIKSDGNAELSRLMEAAACRDFEKHLSAFLMQPPPKRWDDLEFVRCGTALVLLQLPGTSSRAQAKGACTSHPARSTLARWPASLMAAGCLRQAARRADLQIFANRVHDNTHHGVAAQARPGPSCLFGRRGGGGLLTLSGLPGNTLSVLRTFGK